MPTPILHSTWSWLPMTQNWILAQIASLPAGEFEAHVACEVTENLDLFGWPRLHVARRRSLPRRVRDLGLRLLGRPPLWYTHDIGRATGCRLLHSHFGNHAWHDLASARRLGVPQVATFYGFDVNQLPRQRPLWRRRYRQLFDSVAMVLCEGPHMAACIGELGCPAERIGLMPLGVDLDRIAYRPRQWSPERPLRVLIAASFREKKGIPYAIAALGRLARDLPVAVTVVGDAGRDPASRDEKRRILQAAAAARLDQRIRFVGFVDPTALQAIAADHDVFVSPSVTAADGDTEGGAPVAIIEMLAAGMPVVATRHCDIPFVVGPAGAPLLAAERDIADLEARLRQLCALSDWSSITLPARRHVEAQHGLDGLGQRLATIYRRLLAGGAGT